MTDNRQYAALEWVLDEIKDTLTRTSQALEAYARDDDDITQLRFCLTYLHQVYGTLHMVEFHSAAMLAEEMELLAQALVEKSIVNREEAQEVLMRAILQLPNYLEQVKETRQDYPSTVLSLINDLRAARGVNLLHNSSFFTPDLSHAYRIRNERQFIAQDDNQFKLVTKKLRQMYQQATASIVDQSNVDQNLEYLTKVCEHLQKITHNTYQFAVWEITAALVEGLQQNIITLTSTVKSVFHQLDQELECLSKYGIAILDKRADEGLLKTLLYCVAYTQGETKLINNVKENYALDITNQKVLKLTDNTALRSVSSAIELELDDIKNTLNHCLENEDPKSHLDDIKQVLIRVNDTLAVLGIGSLRQKIQSQLSTLQSLQEQDSPITNEQLLNVAHNIVEIEDNVKNALNIDQGPNAGAPSSNYHFDKAQVSVLRESRNGLEKAKDAITEYIATQWDIESIKLAPALLRETCGGLSMLSLDRPSQILDACADYIQQQLISAKIPPEWPQLDSLADAIASIDYYLECMLSSFSDDNEFLLNVAEKSVASLGYAVAVPISREEDAESAMKLATASKEAEAFAAPEDQPSTVFVADDMGVEQPATVVDSEDDDLLDDEIIEIFTEEAEEVTKDITVFLPKWAADSNDANSLKEIRRAFHTLKGSGRMVQADEIGELAWSIENMLNRIIDATIPTNDAINETIANLIQKVCDILTGMIEAFKNRTAPSQQLLVEQYMTWGHQIANGEPVDISDKATNLSKTVVDRDVDEQSLVNLEKNITERKNVIVSADGKEEIVVDSQLLEIFITESTSHLNTIKKYIAEVEASMPIFCPPSDLIQRALHTLKGSAFITEILPIAALMTSMEDFAKELRSYQVNINVDILQLIKDCVSYTEAALDQLAKNTIPEIPKLEQFIDRVSELREIMVGSLIHQQEQQNELRQVDPKLLENFMATEMDLLLKIDSTIDMWRSNGSQSSDWQAIADELGKLRIGAKYANLPEMVRLSDDLWQFYNSLISGDIDTSNNCYDLLQEAHNTLLNMVDAVAAGQNIPDIDESLFIRLKSLQHVESHRDLFLDVEPQLQSESTVIPSAKMVEDEREDVDDEIVEIFLDEANELLEEMDEIIHKWESDRLNASNNSSLQRSLHTFKGGARLSGLMSLGNLAHDFETVLFDNRNNSLTDDFFLSIQNFQDKLRHATDAVISEKDGTQQPTIVAIEAKEREVAEKSVTIDTPTVINPVADFTLDQSADINTILPLSPPRDATLRTILPEPSASAVIDNAAEKRRSAVKEVIKVPADLMEELVNLAGETSISRGRMEEQISEIGLSLDDMHMTVQRLQEQIRRLDIETEAQVVFRQEQMAAELSEFDPLEMDRYTQLQQLTRSLIESASDLMDLKSTLMNKARDTETILLQQSRINTDLQEGLMRSRMVPFSRMVPRLRRIIRQISSELNKSVSFELDNVEGELDRSILEKMAAPLEHMLRNAVDHGIEDTETRIKLGKPAKGRIVLSLSREGGDMLLRMTDDGRGINLEKVRQKAVERKLINADAQLNDQDILQFILHAGFSTADKVTQISGRGVGMDVVNSEIKQIGGSISIESIFSEGTAFIIRLPFTVSVNRALMVMIGEHRYAIPLNTIEGIVLIKPDELKKYYSNPSTNFEYAGKHYQVRYLASIINSQAKPKLGDDNLSVPMLLVRSGDHGIALQVDQLQGSREIVVKSLGSQFNAVQGLSGVTIMGDGNVIIILDLQALLRRDAMLSQNPSFLLEANSEKAVIDKPLLVMVVDDSVTVRKVTTRLLERAGFDVVTAKDGVEAMNMLQDCYPDVMLLDIEMPRMDGFEVTKNVRSSATLKKLPIIMITSRTGNKHRERGLSLGVNIYMGKPFQEETLLSNIGKVVEAESSIEH